MANRQWITVSVFMALFLLLYFGCDTKSNKTKTLEKSRELNFETVSISVQRENAVTKLQEPEKQELLYLEQQAMHADSMDRIKMFEKLSGFWYANKGYLLAGDYARRIADTRNDAQAWSISGSSHFICAKNVTNEDEKTHCLRRAIQSFENAISIDPGNVDAKINLALCHVDFPTEDNPMKGIQQLLSLQKSNPDNTSILLQLARLGIRTGQYEKAQARLLNVLELEPNNKEACCYLVDIASNTGDTENIEQYQQCCIKK